MSITIVYLEVIGAWYRHDRAFKALPADTVALEQSDHPLPACRDHQGTCVSEKPGAGQRMQNLDHSAITDGFNFESVLNEPSTISSPSPRARTHQAHRRAANSTEAAFEPEELLHIVLLFPLRVGRGHR